MDNVFRFLRRMNVLAWVLGLFVAHALFYLLIGTDNWLTAALLAAAVYGVLLMVLRMVARRGVADKEEMR
ncbi:hypothetical protein [Brevibacillus migulae]|uniref:hypothetical protein n=1 Tax=Brevibacillus migulae TaxID=1644114 RepID=UPI001F375932|nr:hypothetical protein [Brevibacillus migulae]